MRHWYRDRIVWTDKDLNLKLMRKGLLTRIYAPMVIVQGLKEAGVFSNALASGHAVLKKSISKEQFLSSVSVSNRTNSSVAQAVENKDGDKHQAKLIEKVEDETHAATRKLLETSIHTVMAVPPLAPPSLDVYTGSF